MREFISSLKIPVGAFAKCYPDGNLIRLTNFHTLMKNLGRDPLKIAVINYDSRGNCASEPRIVEKSDEIYFSRGWKPVFSHDGWPHSNCIITKNPEITLIANVADATAIYFHDKANSFVGTMICNTLTISEQDIIERSMDVIKTMANPEDILIEYSPHLCPRHLKLEYDEAIKFFDEKSLIDNGGNYVQIIIAQEIKKRFVDCGVKLDNIKPMFDDETKMCSCCAVDSKQKPMWSSMRRERNNSKSSQRDTFDQEYDILLCWIGNKVGVF